MKIVFLVACAVQCDAALLFKSSGAETQQKRNPTYALGFHGEYQRDLFAGAHYKYSDFFINYANIKENIITPLEQQGGTVVTYFDTFSFTKCPEHDKRLIHTLTPARYNFSDDWDHRIVDSYIRVLQLIQQDQASVDYIILLRFDVQYHLPISSMDIKWPSTNAAFHDKDLNWDTCKMVSDLFFVSPKSHLQALMDAFDWSGDLETSYGRCTHRTGPGHFVYEPFVKSMGIDSFNFIDKNYSGSSNLRYDLANMSFLWVNNELGEDYYTC